MTVFHTLLYNPNHEISTLYRGSIKGWAQGKLTACEHEFARLFLTLGFQHYCTC